MVRGRVMALTRSPGRYQWAEIDRMAFGRGIAPDRGPGLGVGVAGEGVHRVAVAEEIAGMRSLMSYPSTLREAHSPRLIAKMSLRIFVNR